MKSFRVNIIKTKKRSEQKSPGRSILYSIYSEPEQSQTKSNIMFATDKHYTYLP